MSEHGRYGATEERSRGDYRRPGGESIFGSGGWYERERSFGFGDPSRERERDRDRERHRRDNQPGGWFGEGRSSDYEERGRDRGHGERRERHYGVDDEREGLPIDETSRLIASNKVEGTPVYGREGERLGTIYNFMVDKFSGQVQYAVMSYGGFLGLGQRYFPLPWRMLIYDSREGGYHIDMTDRDLERAPSFGRHDEPRFDRAYGRRVHSWYGLDY